MIPKVAAGYSVLEKFLKASANRYQILRRRQASHLNRPDVGESDPRTQDVEVGLDIVGTMSPLFVNFLGGVGFLQYFERSGCIRAARVHPPFCAR